MLSILIVEDDITFSLMLTTWLGKKGFVVRSSSSVSDAKRRLGEEAFDLVISDLRLPDSDGIDLLKWLKSTHPSLPLIMMTSYAEIQTAVQAMKLGAETASERVKEVREEDGIKIIVTDQKEYPCKAVILATGVAHRHLGIPQEEALAGSGVSYCATCDGAFFRGKDVAVIGGGNTALQDAEFLSNYCNKVYVVHRRDEFRGESNLVDVLKEKDNVEFVLDSIVKDIEGKFMVERLFLRNKKTGEDFHIPVSGVFVAIGQIPQNEIFDGLVRLDENGFILASEDCMTSHPGIFAAGDCRTKEVRQLTTAAADGSVAALAACKYLSMNF